MKWFKLHSQLSDEDTIYIAEYGLEYYGRYILLMQEVAKNSDANSGKVECLKMNSQWKNLLQLNSRSWAKFLASLATVSVEFDKPTANLTVFRIPKLLEYKDTRNKNRPLDIDIDIDKNIKEKNIKKEKKKNNDFQIPDWVDAEAWDGFLKMRKANKIPNTERALTQIVKKLDEYRSRGDPPAEVLDQSTINNWRGVFPLRKGNQNGKYKNNSEPDSWAEAIRRASEKEEGNDASIGIGLRLTENLRQDPERARIAD